MMDIRTETLLKNAATAEASKVALPGSLGPAFGSVQDMPVVGVGGEKTPWFVRPVVDYDLQIMQELGLQDIESKDGRMGEKVCMLCYLFTHPVRDVRRLIRMGVDDFAETALDTFYNVPANQALLEPIGKLIAKQHERYAATRVQFAPAKEGKDGEHFFPGSEESKTVLAGS